MYNDIFSIGPFTMHMYGLMIAIGIIAAYLTAERRAKKQGLDSEKIFDFVIWCLIFGFLGSKILYCLTILPQILKDPQIIIRSFGDGWVVYGGILGGILGAYLFCRKHKLEIWKYFDLGLPSVALAQAIGRLGCFFAGCCYGTETKAWFGITFHNSDFAPNEVSLVPTQLISSGLDFLLFGLLLWVHKRQKKDGQVTALYLILYSAGRFILEFFRGDLIRGNVGTLSTSQFISIFTFAAGLILLWIRSKSKSKPVAEVCEETVKEEKEEKEL